MILACDSPEVVWLRGLVLLGGITQCCRQVGRWGLLLGIQRGATESAPIGVGSDFGKIRAVWECGQGTWAGQHGWLSAAAASRGGAYRCHRGGSRPKPVLVAVEAQPHFNANGENGCLLPRWENTGVAQNSVFLWHGWWCRRHSPITACTLVSAASRASHLVKSALCSWWQLWMTFRA